jgi:hypothetical protein
LARDGLYARLYHMQFREEERSAGQSTTNGEAEPPVVEAPRRRSRGLFGGLSGIA